MTFKNNGSWLAMVYAVEVWARYMRARRWAAGSAGMCVRFPSFSLAHFQPTLAHPCASLALPYSSSFPAHPSSP